MMGEETGPFEQGLEGSSRGEPIGTQHGVTWQTTGHVCETLPPRERVLEEQRHPGCDAVGLGLTEKCHAWALQRFGLVLTWFQPVSQAPSGLSIPLELSEVLPEGIDTAQVI